MLFHSRGVLWSAPLVRIVALVKMVRQLGSNGSGERKQVGMRRDSKTVVDWINGETRVRPMKGAFGDIQRQLRGWWRHEEEGS